MSTSTQESVYNLIPKDSPPVVKPQRYQSKFHGNVKTELKQNRSSNKTLGPTKVPLNPPQDYLKKRTKEPRLPEKKEFQYSDKEGRKPAVPKHTEKPQLGVKSNRNFITTNAVSNIMSVAKKPTPVSCDTVMGDKQELEHSGLLPKYVTKKEYGKVPSYLQKRQQDMAEAQAEYDHYIQESCQRDAMGQLSEEERSGILAGLKEKWQDLYQQYQGLSVVTDTISKRMRKEWMEEQMRQIEKDIETIEKHTSIYVAQP